MNNTDTFTSTDQNTGRTITWNIVGITENGPRTFIKSGYTHTVCAVRSNGRRAYAIAVEIFDGEIVRSATPVKGW